MPMPTKQPDPKTTVESKPVPVAAKPVAPKAAAQTMNFFQALTLLFEHGAKVRSESWDDPRTHLFVMENENLYIFGGEQDDDKYHPFLLSLGDYNTTDWVRCNS